MLLRLVPMLPLLAAFGSALSFVAGVKRRVRPADRAWPAARDWQDLNRAVGGRLGKVQSPLQACVQKPGDPAACAQLFSELRNPYYLGDEPGLTQTLGWVDAWTTAPSEYAVAAVNTGDVVAAVRFAKDHNLRLVVKGGGHSYQGTSNAADSLLIWTRHMNDVTVLDAFVPAGCGSVPARPAVSIGAGAIWMQAYDAVTTQRGRYVQGGGCTTVGVAGLVQSGGFGSFSKRFGTAAGGLLEAEVVTADGAVRLVNACQEPDLFWSLKGGGGGSFGVVTRVTLATHELPQWFGTVYASIQATSDAAFRRLVVRMLTFYRDSLFNPQWGEQIILQTDRVLKLQMLSQGVDRVAAEALWHDFFAAIEQAPADFRLLSKPVILEIPARHLWDPALLNKVPGAAVHDDRPGAAAGNLFWAGDAGQCGQVLHGYDSAWLPATLLQPEQVQSLADALCAAARHWQVALHTNKGLAGAPRAALDAAAATAMNPAVLDAFALAILGGEEPPAYPGVAGHEPHVAAARRSAASIERAMAELRKVAPAFASYVSEGNYFERQWQSAFWGTHYPRLLTVKAKFDPEGLFYVHHGVGSEAWSNDGFTRVA